MPIRTTSSRAFQYQETAPRSSHKRPSADTLCRMIANPWLGLDPACPPYVLEMDRSYIERHNAKARPQHQLMLNSIPEPFIGDPNTATVVLLSLNPGHCSADEPDHRRPAIKKAIFRNLCQEPQEYPFYAFNPDFRDTGVEVYWRKYTCALQLEARLDDASFAKRLLVIEWFPYHSEKCNLDTRYVCGSQLFSFELAKEMVRKGVQVIGMRSREHWVQVHPSFASISFLANKQSPWLTRRNMGEQVYRRVLNALRK